MIDKIKEYYKLIKVKKIDDYLIKVGILGVIIGIVFSISIACGGILPVISDCSLLIIFLLWF